MIDNRLDVTAPALAARFSSSDPRQRRRAVLLACEMAVAGSDLIEKQALEAFEELRGGTTTAPQLLASLGALEADLDEEYFQRCFAGDDDEEPEPVVRAEGRRFFVKARAVAALKFALMENGAESAIYEAIAATGEDGALVESLWKLLE